MCNDNHDFVLRFTAIILRYFIHKLHMKTRKITEINHKLLKKKMIGEFTKQQFINDCIKSLITKKKYDLFNRFKYRTYRKRKLQTIHEKIL